MHLPTTAPFDDQQRVLLDTALAGLNQEQALWLSRFLVREPGVMSASLQKTAALPPLTILFGSESGNAEALAEDAKQRASRQGFAVTLKDMEAVRVQDLPHFTKLLVLVSTWGEGDPPDRATSFYEALMGVDVPKLDRVHFSILALGDTTYEHFCKIGKDLDVRLESLGAQRFYPRVDCDVDYDESYQRWIAGALHELELVAKPSASPQVKSAEPSGGEVTSAIEYGKRNPFPSELKHRVLLSARDSAKETYHFELSLEGSGLVYEPGDVLALIPKNCPEVLDAFIEAGLFGPEEVVPAPNGREGPLKEILSQYYDITGLTKSVLKKYHRLAQVPEIEALLDDASKDRLKDYLYGREIVDMLIDFPLKDVSAREFVSILRKMPPRLYSIASSLKAHPGEVHLTIAAVRYEAHGRQRKGVASTFMSDRIVPGELVSAYVHPNKNFKLPSSGETPIIMVGPGTGVAPFRSFIEDRQADGAPGKSWLFFGDQHYTHDFLYQLEWQAYLKAGSLSQLDVAFSRDQKQKCYVQHCMVERGAELYRWLEEGAHFYVCGDASRMAGDVHEALISIVAKEGDRSREDAEAYVKALQKAKRYQRDVY